MELPFVISRRSSAVALEPSDRPLKLIPLTVHPMVVRLGTAMIPLGWDHSANASTSQLPTSDTIAVPAVAHQLLRALLGSPRTVTFHLPPVEQWAKADHVVALTTSEVKSERFSLPPALEV